MGDIQFNGTPEEWDALVKKNKKQETLEEVKDLNYWRSNAEEDYLQVPISVLRYITELEMQQERSYSEEELLSFGKFCIGKVADFLDGKGDQTDGREYSMEELFENFKNKQDDKQRI